MVTTLTNTVAPTVKYLTQGFQQPFAICPSGFTFSVTPSTSPVCAGTNITIDVITTGGIGPFTYLWSSGQTTTVSNMVVAPSITTAYTFTISGCSTITGTHTVSVSPAIAASVSLTDVSCFSGSDGSATASATGGTGSLTYLWSNGQTANTATGLSAGTYSVAVTDAAGCTGTGRYSFWLEDFTLADGTLTDAGATAWTRTVTAVTAAVNAGKFEVAATGANGSMTWASQSITITSYSGGVDLSVALSESGTLDVGDVITTSYSLNGAAQIPFPINGSIADDFPPVTAKATGLIGTTVQIFINVQFDVVSPSEKYLFDNVSVAGSPFAISSPTSAVTASPGSDVTICNGSNATLSVSATGGTGAYSYNWQPVSQSTSAITVNPTFTTEYTVTVTDANSCTALATNTVTVNSTATPTVTAMPNPLCVGQTLSLNASPVAGATGYIWTGIGSFTGTGQNVNIPNVQSTASGTYSVVATNSVTGCSSPPGNISVTVNPLPVAAFTSTSVCMNTPTSFTDQSSITSGSITGWAWNFGDNGTAAIQNPVHTYTTSGNYAVTLIATSNWGCSSPVQTTTVIINPVPTVSINGIGSFNTTLCSGGNVNLPASASGGGPFTYNWSPPAWLNDPAISNPIASPNTPTEYTVTVTSASSCTAIATASITVNPIPTLSVSAKNALCAGDCNGSATATVTTGTAPFTYSWSSPPGGTTPTISNLCAGPLSVTVTAGTCSAIGTVTVTDPAPLTASITTTPPLCGCNGSAAAAPSGGSLPYTYSWFPSSQTNKTATGLCASQTVTVTDNNACLITTTANLTPSGVIIMPVSPATICAGGTTTIGVNASTANGALNYVWSPGGGTTDVISVSPTISITYTVTVTNVGSNCKGIAFVPVTVNLLPIVGITGAGTICSGSNATLNASGGTTYTWNTASITNPLIVTPSAPTSYTVTATDPNGCTDTASFFVSVTPSPTASITASSTSVCAGGTATLTASGGSTYFWAPVGSTSAVIVTPPLTSSTASYTVTVFNGACFDTQAVSINVTNFSANITITNNDSTLCAGETSLLTATPPGASYSWSTGETTQNIPINPAGTTTYVVTVTNAGCKGTDSMLVTVNSVPSVSVSSTYTTICTGLNNTTLTASPTNASNYSWLPGIHPNNDTIKVNPQNSITYSVVVTNTAGCTGIGSIYINVITNPYPQPVVNPASSSYCLGDSILPLWVSNPVVSPALVVWFKDSATTWWTGNPYSPSQTLPIGTVSGWVTQGIPGCFAWPTAISITINSLPVVSAGADITICPGFTADLNATATGNASNYLWSPGHLLNDSTVQNPSANPDTSTLFFVTVTDATGSCNASDTVMVYSVSTPDCKIKIYNGITPNGDNDNDSWYIDGIQGYPENKVIIFNRWGTRIWWAKGYDNKKVIWRGTDQQGNVLPDATYYYFVELYNGEGGTTFKESGWVEVTH